MSLPLLPRSEERALVVDGLLRYAGVLLGANAIDSKPSGEELRTTIRAYVDEPVGLEAPLPVEAEHLPDELDELEELLQTFQYQRLVIAMPEWEDVIGGSAAHRVFKTLRIRETHPEELPEMESGGGDSLAATVWNNPTALAATHFVVVECGSSDDGYKRSHTDGTPPPGHRPWWSRKSKLDDFPIQFPVNQVGECESFHIELRCPAGVYIGDAWLTLVRGDVSDSGEEYEVVLIEDDDRRADAAHVQFSNYSGVMRGEGVTTLEATLSVTLRPMYHGGMRAGVVTSWVCTATLVALAFTLGWASTGWPSVATVNADNTSIVAILVLAPSIALVSLVQANEHPLTKWVLDGFRKRLALTAIAMYASALVIAVGTHGVLLFALLSAASCICLVLAAMTQHSASESKKIDP